MRTSDEIKTRLNHVAHELRYTLQSIATASDRVQTALDEVQVCNDRALFIDPTIDALNHQISTLTEEMDRVCSLRNDESDLYLRQENAKLKRDIGALQQALRREKEEHQADRAEAARSHDTLVQHIENLERFNGTLKKRVAEMKELYETAIIDNVDLKDAILSLQSTPAITASSNPTGGTSRPSIPYGKTVIEANRGVAMSSHDGSPDKASMNQSWSPHIVGDTPFSFPDTVAQSQFTNLISANEGSTKVTIRDPGKPKSRPIVRGTQEANESFERMKLSLASFPLTDSTNTLKVDKNATVPSSSSAPGLSKSVINPFEVDLRTPSKVQSKFNPAVAAFTPSNSVGKGSAKSGTAQAFSPSNNAFELPLTATSTKDEDFHEKTKIQGTVATGDQNVSAEEVKPPQAISLVPRVLPHLRHLAASIKNQDSDPPKVQRSSKGKSKETIVEENEFLSRESALTGPKAEVRATTTSDAFVSRDPGLQAWLDSQEQIHNNDAATNNSASTDHDMLIEFDTESPQAKKKKPATLPPGFVPISTNEAPTMTKIAAAITTNRAASPIDRVTSSNPTAAEPEKQPTAEPELSSKATAEKENIAAFVAQYTKKLSSVNEKYGKAPRQSSDETDDKIDPVQYAGAKPDYTPPPPTGTRELGALLDDECYKMVIKTEKEAVKDADVAQGWKAVRTKDGKLVYVL